MNTELNTLRESMVEVYISDTIIEHLESLTNLRDRLALEKDKSAHIRKVIKFEGTGYQDVFATEIFYMEHSADDFPKVLYSLIPMEDYERISKAINEKKSTDINSLHLGGKSYKKWVFTV